MINAVNLGGLLMDISGAVLLARALLTSDVDRYADQTIRTPTALPLVNYLSSAADLDHARDHAECRLGLALLIGGFAGQLLGTALPSGPGWLEMTFAALAVCTVVAAAVVRPKYVQAMQKAMICARIRQIERAPSDMVNIDTWDQVLRAYRDVADLDALGLTDEVANIEHRIRHWHDDIG
jgi:hypothetical protein